QHRHLAARRFLPRPDQPVAVEVLGHRLEHRGRGLGLQIVVGDEVDAHPGRAEGQRAIGGRGDQGGRLGPQRGLQLLDAPAQLGVRVGDRGQRLQRPILEAQAEVDVRQVGERPRLPRRQPRRLLQEGARLLGQPQREADDPQVVVGDLVVRIRGQKIVEAAQGLLVLLLLEEVQRLPVPFRGRPASVRSLDTGRGHSVRPPASAGLALALAAKKMSSEPALTRIGLRSRCLEGRRQIRDSRRTPDSHDARSSGAILLGVRPPSRPPPAADRGGRGSAPPPNRPRCGGGWVGVVLLRRMSRPRDPAPAVVSQRPSLSSNDRLKLFADAVSDASRARWARASLLAVAMTSASLSFDAAASLPSWAARAAEWAVSKTLTPVPALARPWVTWSMLWSTVAMLARTVSASLPSSAVLRERRVAKMSTPPPAPWKILLPETEASSNWPGATSARRMPSSPE